MCKIDLRNTGRDTPYRGDDGEEHQVVRSHDATTSPLCRPARADGVAVFAPCRIDCGNRLDLKPIALLLEHCRPCTLNIAISVGVTTELVPHRRGVIRVSLDDQFDEQARSEDPPLHGPAALPFAVALHAGLDGIHLRLSSTAPFRSGLGGSGAAPASVLGACFAAQGLCLDSIRVRRRIAHVAHLIESSFSISVTGMQDQLAAAFGSANLWTWTYSHPMRQYTREELLAVGRRAALESRFLVAYTGSAHAYANMSRTGSTEIMGSRERRGWTEVAEVTRRLGCAIQREDWVTAAELLSRENSIRRELTPERLTPTADRLIQIAEECGCGGRFTGGGAGGCVWALGPSESISCLRTAWSAALASLATACLVPASVDWRGVRVLTPTWDRTA